MKVSDLASLLIDASPSELRRSAQELRSVADLLDGAAQRKEQGAHAAPEGDAEPRPGGSVAGSLSDRLAFALKHAGLRQAELERKAGLSQGFLSRPISGKAETIRTKEKVQAIAKVCGVNWLWLWIGEGVPLATSDSSPEGTVERG